MQIPLKYITGTYSKIGNTIIFPLKKYKNFSSEIKKEIENFVFEIVYSGNEVHIVLNDEDYKQLLKILDRDYNIFDISDILKSSNIFNHIHTFSDVVEDHVEYVAYLPFRNKSNISFVIYSEIDTYDAVRRLKDVLGLELNHNDELLEIINNPKNILDDYFRNAVKVFTDEHSDDLVEELKKGEIKNIELNYIDVFGVSKLKEFNETETRNPDFDFYAIVKSILNTIKILKYLGFYKDGNYYCYDIYRKLFVVQNEQLLIHQTII